MSSGADAKSGHPHPPNWKEVRRWLETLLETPEKDREAKLLKGCSDAGVRQRVLELLAAEVDSHGFLEPTQLGDTGLIPGASLGRYLLVQEIGRGGQGTVYLAEDPQLDRTVALKVLTAWLPHPDQIARFRREALLASKLNHHGLCTIYDAGEASGVLYIAMRYVEGESLSRMIAEDRSPHLELSTDAEAPAVARTKLTTEAGLSQPQRHNASVLGSHKEKAQLVEKVARALHAAHALGIIHRDIKPSNIVVTKASEPVLMDFGLAREEATGATLTQSGAVFGTPAYMAPEQIESHRGPVDARTDVYALGVTLYELLSGRRPFQAATTQGLYKEILGSPLKSLRSLNPKIPKDLDTIVQTAIAKEPTARYTSAQEFADDLRRYLDRKPIAAKPTSRLTHLKRWTQRNPLVATSLAIAFLALAGGLVASISFGVARDRALADKTQALDRFYKLSDSAEVEALAKEAESLWPRREALIPSLRNWLRRSDLVLAREPAHLKEFEALEAKLGEYTEAVRMAEAEDRRRLYPALFDELESRTSSLASVLETQARMVRPEHKALLGDQIRQLELDIQRLTEDPRLSERMNLDFDDPSDLWRYRVLKELTSNLDRLNELRESVVDRLHFARVVRQASTQDDQAAARWQQCLQSIAQDSTYEAAKDMKPQVGLYPLGRDQDSGLWEFWHMGSGTQPAWKGKLERGQAQLTEDDAGMVMVLLPGGAFNMGAQSRKRTSANHDRMARPNERPVTKVTLAPFFLSKYEVTQAQWTRLASGGNNPSFYREGSIPAGRKLITGRNPVEGLSWKEAKAYTRKLDLLLPTEAQWEYAARAGTQTPWWSGGRPASLNECANLADSSAKAMLENPQRGHEDGHLVHAPVGSFKANGFGLHDMMGNVWEWTGDRFSVYTAKPRTGDGRREPFGAKVVYRGGCHSSTASQSRVSARFTQPSNTRGSTSLGVRPAKAIE